MNLTGSPTRRGKCHEQHTQRSRSSRNFNVISKETDSLVGGVFVCLRRDPSCFKGASLGTLQLILKLCSSQARQVLLDQKGLSLWRKDAGLGASTANKASRMFKFKIHFTQKPVTRILRLTLQTVQPSGISVLIANVLFANG